MHIVFPGFLKPVLTQISFQGHQLLFSNASAEVRGKNTPERKFASTRSQTHNHQVMSLTRTSLSHLGGDPVKCDLNLGHTRTNALNGTYTRDRLKDLSAIFRAFTISSYRSK